MIRILIIDNDEQFVANIKNALSHIGVEIDHRERLASETLKYDFYVISKVKANVLDLVKDIRKKNKRASIFLECSAGHNIPAKQLLRCDIEGVVDKVENDIKELVNAVTSYDRSTKKLQIASDNLDYIKKEMLKSTSSTSFPLAG